MNFWDNYHYIYDRFIRSSPTYNQMITNIISYLNSEKNIKILDAGCGTGYLSSKLSEIGYDVYSVDYSKNALDILSKRVNGAKIYHADLSKELFFNDNMFDEIVCVNALYSIGTQSINSVMAEFYRILKKGGTIVVTDPKKNFSNFKIFLSDLNLLKRNEGLFFTGYFLIKNLSVYIRLFFYNKTIDKNARNNIYNFFDERQYNDLFESCGFTVISIKHEYANQNLLVIAKK